MFDVAMLTDRMTMDPFRSLDCDAVDDVFVDVDDNDDVCDDVVSTSFSPLSVNGCSRQRCDAVRRRRVKITATDVFSFSSTSASIRHPSSSSSLSGSSRSPLSAGCVDESEPGTPRTSAGSFSPRRSEAETVCGMFDLRLRRLPEVVEDHQRQPEMVGGGGAATTKSQRGFMIEEILRPDFGVSNRRSATKTADCSLPVSGAGLWQPFAGAPRSPLPEMVKCIASTFERRAENRSSANAVDRQSTNCRRPEVESDIRNRKQVVRRKQHHAVSVESRNDIQKSDQPSSKQNAMDDPLRPKPQPPSSSALCSSSSPTSGSGSLSTDMSTSGQLVCADKSSASHPAAASAPLNCPTGFQLPAWVYCTRYSDRPSSGPRSRKSSRRQRGRPSPLSAASGPSSPGLGSNSASSSGDDKRPRTAFNADQLAILRREFEASRYLTEDRRQRLAAELDLHESQVKIWFQNKRAKLKKASGVPNPLALELMAQGLYNHSSSAAAASRTAAVSPYSSD